MNEDTLYDLLMDDLFQIAAIGGTAFLKWDISEKQKRNAVERYAKGVAEHDIVGMIDFTMTENGKNGIVFTTEGIYYRELQQSANRIRYKDIRKVEINDYEEKDCDRELLFYCNDEGTWNDKIATVFLNKSALAELLRKIAEENGQPFEIVFSSDEWDDCEDACDEEDDYDEEMEESEYEDIAEDDETEDGYDDDDVAPFYPKPSKYFQPRTNTELILGNIKRKLKF